MGIIPWLWLVIWLLLFGLYVILDRRVRLLEEMSKLDVDNMQKVVDNIGKHNEMFLALHNRIKRIE